MDDINVEANVDSAVGANDGGGMDCCDVRLTHGDDTVVAFVVADAVVTLMSFGGSRPTVIFVEDMIDVALLPFSVSFDSFVVLSKVAYFESSLSHSIWHSGAAISFCCLWSAARARVCTHCAATYSG